MTEYDVSTFPDLDPMMGWVTGTKAIGQCVARRFLTPRGLLDYDTEYGLDLRQFLNEGLTAARLGAIRGLVEQECLKDERVDAASVDLTFEPSAFFLSARISLETTLGPVTLTLAIDKVSAAVLAVD